MKHEKETIRCEAIFNEEHTHRYLWRRVWNKDKPLACVIMLNACCADTLITDTTTTLVVNNIARLEKYGGVEIVNLYSLLTNKLNFRWNSDEMLNDAENDTYIRKSAEACEIVILAWGTGASVHNRIILRIDTVMELLKDCSEKMYVITDGEKKGLHPLVPSIRAMWNLEKYIPEV